MANEELLEEMDPLRLLVEFSSGVPHAAFGKVKRTMMKEATRVLENFMIAGWFPVRDDWGRRRMKWGEKLVMVRQVTREPFLKQQAITRPFQDNNVRTIGVWSTLLCVWIRFSGVRCFVL